MGRGPRKCDKWVTDLASADKWGEACAAFVLLRGTEALSVLVTPMVLNL